MRSPHSCGRLAWSLVLMVCAGVASGAAPKEGEKSPPPVPEKIYLNQAGFDTLGPKRFTAPTLSDGTAFEVKRISDSSVVLRGKIEGNTGDFSELKPGKSGEEFIIEAGGEKSVPFAVGHYLIEKLTYQPAVNFMIQSRHYVGNVPDTCPGSQGWRDDHHFAFEVPTLVAQYLSNPAAYDRMPRQVKYVKPDKRNLWGELLPPNESAPDIVKLIHWGTDVVVTQKYFHAMNKHQLAAFLYGYPAYDQHISRETYEKVLKLTLEIWEQDKVEDPKKYKYDETPATGHNMLALDTKVGSTKGSHPPGHSVLPNLYMYEVAKREKLPDADRFLKAATEQIQWLAAQDWSDPRMTKGQRMSEYVTVMGIAAFGIMHPDLKPAGYDALLSKWTQIAAARSQNMWDFRKLSDTQWTPTGTSPQHWNEVGNVTGFPACALGIKNVLKDDKQRAVLDRLAYAHLDNMFGRNPTGRHFCYRAPSEIKGVEYGWYSFLKGGIGKLAEVEFVLDGAPKNAHYPYNPQIGNVGWTEGWVNFNTSYNMSLAMLAFDRTRITLWDEHFKQPLEQVTPGQRVGIRLEAPLNFNYEQVEDAAVQVSVLEQAKPVKVTETNADARSFDAVYTVPAGLKPGDKMTVTYGEGWLQRRAQASVR